MADHPFNLRSDLAASMEARRELGPTYERELVESFCDRIEQTVQQRLDPRPAAQPPHSGDSQPFVIALVSLGSAIPITALAANTAGAPGTALSWLGIVGVNAVFAMGRRHRR